MKYKIKTVYSFSDSNKALEFFKNKKAEIDIIISDMEMPRLNGIELLKAVRSIDREIPFIVISAFLKPEYLMDSIKFNVTSYFQKPIDINKLFNKLDTFFYRKVNYEKLHNQKNEIQSYLDALENVALVSKTDLSGNITYVNDIFFVKYQNIVKKNSLVKMKIYYDIRTLLKVF